LVLRWNGDRLSAYSRTVVNAALLQVLQPSWIALLSPVEEALVSRVRMVALIIKIADWGARLNISSSIPGYPVLEGNITFFPQDVRAIQKALENSSNILPRDLDSIQATMRVLYTGWKANLAGHLKYATSPGPASLSRAHQNESPHGLLNILHCHVLPDELKKGFHCLRTFFTLLCASSTTLQTSQTAEPSTASLSGTDSCIPDTC